MVDSSDGTGGHRIKQRVIRERHGSPKRIRAAEKEMALRK